MFVYYFLIYFVVEVCILQTCSIIFYSEICTFVDPLPCYSSGPALFVLSGVHMDVYRRIPSLCHDR